MFFKIKKKVVRTPRGYIPYLKTQSGWKAVAPDGAHWGLPEYVARSCVYNSLGEAKRAISEEIVWKE